MYNEERKRQYLQEKSAQSIIANNLELAMVMAETREKEYDRDMAEWTVSEIISFFKYYSSTSVQTLVQLKNSIEGYVDWCIMNGLVMDNQNHYRDISIDTLCSCVDLSALRRTVMFRDDFLSQIRTLPNFRDQFLLLGLYEGISSKYIDQVKRSDFVRDILILPNGQQQTVSKELLNIVNLADEETECMSMGSKYKNEFGYTNPSNISSESRSQFAESCEYLDGDTLVRDVVSSRRPKLKPRTGIALIGIRMRQCNNYLGVNWTIKNIKESGRLQMILDLSKQFNVEPEKCITDINIRKIHEARFGELQQMRSYLLTYGKLLEDKH